MNMTFIKLNKMQTDVPFCTLIRALMVFRMMRGFWMGKDGIFGEIH
jgi:hypothetical protein